MLEVGHASITRPPLDPHPVEPLTSVDGVIEKVIEVVTPVIVTVDADALHAFAPTAVVGFVKVVFETGAVRHPKPVEVLHVSPFAHVEPNAEYCGSWRVCQLPELLL